MYELPFGLTPYFSYAQSFNPQYQAGCATSCDPYHGEQYEVGFKYQPTEKFAINGAIYEITEQNRLAYGDFRQSQGYRRSTHAWRGDRVRRCLDQLPRYHWRLLLYGLDRHQGRRGRRARVRPFRSTRRRCGASTSSRCLGSTASRLASASVISATSWDGAGHREDAGRDAGRRYVRLGRRARGAFRSTARTSRTSIIIATCLIARRLLPWKRRAPIISNLTYKF